MTKLYAGAALIAMAALLGGTYYVIQSNQSADIFAECRGGAVGGGAIGGPMSLVNGDGQTVTDAEIFTKPTLLYFGYTFCPDVCPMDNARNAEAIDILDESGFDVQPAFISIDPVRDTPEVVSPAATNRSRPPRRPIRPITKSRTRPTNSIWWTIPPLPTSFCPVMDLLSFSSARTAPVIWQHGPHASSQSQDRDPAIVARFDRAPLTA